MLPLYLVYHVCGQPAIKHVRGNSICGMESESSLKRIRELDVTEVVCRPGTELPRHHGIHYEGPNGDHYRAFLRPGFAARSVEELDRFVFWLAPLLLDRDYVVVDHWSMMSIAYHAGHYMTRLDRSSTIGVQSLRRYDEGRDVLARRLGNAFRTVRSNKGAALVSVNSSGRLVRDVLLPAMKDIGSEDSVGIAIAKTPSPSEYEIEALTTLSVDFERYEPDACPACASGKSMLLPIQRDSYLLNLAAYTRTTSITRSVAKPSTQVVERYRNIGAFRVHQTHADGRHHAYFVDLNPILGCKVFFDRLSLNLKAWCQVGIDLVIHPNHPPATQLASMVAAQLSVTCVLECNERISQLTAADQEDLLNAKRICLVDDVTISGSRLFGYRNAINRIRREHGIEECRLYCLVGVARARNEKSLMGISDMVHHTSRDPRFLSVERLFLPDWNEHECRWCAELKLLLGLPNRLRKLPLISKRIDDISTTKGLIDNLFLPWTGEGRGTADRTTVSWPTEDQEYGSRYWELGPRSVFGEVENADLAVSVAAAIQRLRGSRRRSNGIWEESELDEVFRSPLAKVLNPALYIAARYYEPVLIALILRASRRHDIRTPDAEADLTERVEILAAADSSRELHGELLLATALNQLPRTSHDALASAHSDMAAVARHLSGRDVGEGGKDRDRKL